MNRRRWLMDYLDFNRRESRAVVAFLIIIVLLLTVRITMHLWVSPPASANEQELIAAWDQFKKEHTAAGPENMEVSYAQPGTLFNFDPNTLDSSGFIALGMKPKTTHLLLNWRRKGKVFYKKEALSSLYSLSPAEYKRLEPYIVISSVPKNNYSYNSYTNEPLPVTIDLNTTDSPMLVRLNGIGPLLAHKIIEKRNLLGGYLKHEQLMDVYRFPDSVYKMLQKKLVIDARSVRRMKLNTASLEELKQHPYIGEKMARNIIQYREGLQRFGQIEQLRQVPLMDEEKYRKIAPYFTLD